jgi:putative transferase (TIGR04331 family)
MQVKARFLITTADEGTWKFDEPAIFLGEWCRNYDRKHIWQQMDAIVASPYGLGKDKIDLDISKAYKMEDEIFPILCQILNQFHKTEYSDRFWRIIVGHWFREYVTTVLNRVNTIQQCLNNYDISAISGYGGLTKDLSVKQFEPSWYEIIDSVEWNQILFLRILELLPNCNIKLVNIKKMIPPDQKADDPRLEFHKTRSLKPLFFRALEKFTFYFSNKSDAFIVSTYLHTKELIRLQIGLHQIPSFWKIPDLKIEEKPNLNLRSQLASRMVNDSDEDMVKIVKALLFEVIPLAYLEEFELVQRLANEVRFPAHPKFIFTSNAFHGSDICKYYIASQVELGTKYIVGQHGNSYFTHKSKRNCVEEITADHFLTWGWSDGSKRYVPAFIFQHRSKDFVKVKSIGSLLLITLRAGPSRETFDARVMAYETLDMYQEFVHNLTDKLKKALIVRLSMDSRNHPISEKKIWLEFDSSIKIDEGFTPINQLISNSKLVVHGYDSTGILLTLSQNIPTVAFWLNGFDHLNNEVVDDYKLLVEAGIIHLTPESAAQHLNEVWDDIEAWWDSRKVQVAREIFCAKYARTSADPARDLKSILLDLTRDS